MMQRVWCLCAAALAFAATSETVLAGQAGFGVKGAFTAASIRANPDELETQSGWGGAFGAFATTAAGRRIGLQAEALLTWRRFALGESGEIFHVSSRSIEVPLLLRIRAVSGQHGSLWIHAGPQVAGIFGVTQTYRGVSSDVSDRIKNVDVAGVLGVGTERAAGHGAVTFDARAVIGLRDLSESSDVSFKSRGFVALAGYRF